MKTGRVKFYDKYTGFGFIASDEEEQDIYFKDVDTIDIVYEEDKVTFEVKECTDGFSAFDVKKVLLDINEFL